MKKEPVLSTEELKKKIHDLEKEIILMVNHINIMNCRDDISDRNIGYYKRYKKELETKLLKYKTTFASLTNTVINDTQFLKLLLEKGV